jgi:hypothetical protein
VTRVAFAFLVLCVVVALIGEARAHAAQPTAAQPTAAQPDTVRPAGAQTRDAGLFREVLHLENGMLLVVEESALEPRSVGSYALRLYSALDTRFPYDDFRAGLILRREGTLEAVRELPDEQCEDCVMVCIRNVGTGNYWQRHLVSYSESRLVGRGASPMSAGSESCEDFSHGEFEPRH